ncbi:hypothetical protein AVEN_195996-1 [Araneus ventricosus]|uniref:Uncharacterized protein n=1 Tax=Araneus ventricosus TaxID=182803 RepID=A0A4Y2DUK3_ARAVE|nr:hypothetical protein AVEN_195996-1 [Araneus ventricosus]
MTGLSTLKKLKLFIQRLEVIFYCEEGKWETDLISAFASIDFNSRSCVNVPSVLTLPAFLLFFSLHSLYGRLSFDVDIDFEKYKDFLVWVTESSL